MAVSDLDQILRQLPRRTRVDPGENHLRIARARSDPEVARYDPNRNATPAEASRYGQGAVSGSDHKRAVTLWIC